LAHRHFAYRAASEVAKRFPGEEVYTVEAGVTPSGKIHLGNFIDIVVTDSVLKALRELGLNAAGFLVVDSRDPFRQPPTFAPEEFRRRSREYEGVPFENIPDPWGCHGSYAHHFVEPVEESFEEYGVEIRVKWAGEIHRDERFVKLALSVLRQREAVRRIINDVRRRAGHKSLYGEDWLPYRPLCSNCGRIDEAVRPVELVGDGLVAYKCHHCGNEGVADVRRAEGKPPWRIDWPLRWVVLDVKFEPLGKDHMASGSGYDTGCALVRGFFKREPPVPLYYDFVYWMEDGRLEKFSKRKGVGLGIDEWLRYAPPEVLRYQVLRREVRDLFREALSHWYFDFRQIPRYVEEFDKLEEEYFSADRGAWLEDTYRLSVAGRVPPRKPARIPYYQLAKVAAWMNDVEDGLRMLERQGKLRGLDSWELEDVRRRLVMARNWLERAGLSAILSDVETAVSRIEGLDASLRRAFLEAAKRILGGDGDASQAVREAAEAMGFKTRDQRLLVYRAFYIALLGQEEGPPLTRILSRRDARVHLQNIVEALERRMAGERG